MQWLIEDRLENAHIGYRAIVDADGCTVCNPSPMGEANARLIAAAPELFEALETMLFVFGKDIPENVNHEKFIVVDLAKQAIAKARGE